MYEIFERLLAAKGLTAYKVAKDTHITSSTFSEWKNGNYMPKKEKLRKIADYLGVTVDYLMGIDEQLIKASDPINDLLNTDPELIKIIKETIEKGYTANDLRLAIQMLDMARKRG